VGSFYSGCNEGPARACSLSPSKFKTGVRDKSLTPVNSLLILIPITATIRTRQVFFVITVLFLNIVYCTRRGRRWRRIKGTGSSLESLAFKVQNRSKE